MKKVVLREDIGALKKKVRVLIRGIVFCLAVAVLFAIFSTVMITHGESIGIAWIGIGIAIFFLTFGTLRFSKLRIAWRELNLARSREERLEKKSKANEEELNKKCEGV